MLVAVTTFSAFGLITCPGMVIPSVVSTGLGWGTVWVTPLDSLATMFSVGTSGLGIGMGAPLTSCATTASPGLLPQSERPLGSRTKPSAKMLRPSRAWKKRESMSGVLHRYLSRKRFGIVVAALFVSLLYYTYSYSAVVW